MPEQIELIISPWDLEKVLQEHHKEFSITIAKYLLWAMENNVDAFVFADILMDDGERLEPLKLGCARIDYLEAFKKQLNNLLEMEEYELCAKLKPWIEYLEVEEKVKR